jgi:hypothetical protein
MRKIIGNEPKGIKNNNIQYIHDVAEDIIKSFSYTEMKKVNFKKVNLNYLFKKFYSIMRKHGIKRGIKVEGGTQGSTPEWVMCKTLFLSMLESELYFQLLLGEPPKDLRHY